ncbi:MAG: hypothetical protein GWM90_04130 [Gemmatimonadetes bacterium]|nr:hypothetical protein [Gemmatimonadota bacterium]NIQ52851.1 hypothetical protein [Gemmatimonadota bacterium]NIU72981.1 hypothetical protein [Gammaproteobacteria bacterium]NIX43336.1 hypothetical protein [Gemmatimonadota bacterium]NIY11353.1 hypothetical protein [Gemmatimonadota bacterium]
MGAPPETVSVWFHRDGAPAAVERSVPGAGVEAALRALVRGPTGAERAAGYTSWFSDATRSVVRTVEVDSSRVTVDFDAELMTLAPGAGSSSGSGQLLESLDSTVLQFPWVRTAEYRMAGSCAEFWGWLQRECTVVRR